VTAAAGQVLLGHGLAWSLVNVVGGSIGAPHCDRRAIVLISLGSVWIDLIDFDQSIQE